MLVVITPFFTSCDDPQLVDCSDLKGVLKDGNTYSSIDSVYASVYYENTDPNRASEFTFDIIAKAKFQQGSFELHLPSLRDNQLLTPITHFSPKTIFISDTTAMINYLCLRCISKVGYSYEELICHNNISRLDSGYVECTYIYCNKPVTAKGSTKETSWATINTGYYNIDLKKGWNTIILKMRNNGIEYRDDITSSKPSADLMWYFINDSHY